MLSDKVEPAGGRHVKETMLIFFAVIVLDFLSPSPLVLSHFFFYNIQIVLSFSTIETITIRRHQWRHARTRRVAGAR